MNHATVGGKSLREVVKDDKWLNEAFLSKVQKRGAEIIAVMGKSSAASAANAACDHMHDWWFGTKPGQYVSMGVISDKNTYGVPEGVNYSFPVSITNGKWAVVNGFKIDEFSRDKMTKTGAELLEERKMALGF